MGFAARMSPDRLQQLNQVQGVAHFEITDNHARTLPRALIRAAVALSDAATG
jgi:hypothetical protein